MRIAYFNSNLRVGQDGVTRVMGHMFEGALERGHEVLCFGATIPPPSEQRVPMVRVPSVVLPLQKAYRVALPGYSRFATRLREWNPDLIHINSPCTLGYAAVRYARDFGVPIVATYHTHFPTYLRFYKLERFEKRTWKMLRHLYNPIDTTFVPSLSIIAEIREHGIRHTEYLPNGVDLSRFSPSYRSRAWRESVGAADRPVVLFVSRLVWEKNLRTLAEAYAMLRSRALDFAMVVVGDGHSRKELEALMPGAKFLGEQQGDALSTSYASADVFVFPSVTETFGLVTLEAMASGLAPVAARAGGAVGIIQDGKSGLFAEPNDAASLAAQIERLVRDSAMRASIAERATRRAKDFAWGPVLHRLFTRYDQICAEDPLPKEWLPDPTLPDHE
jgi:glycosyltransferase involved in cell wall biosynthesis